jgi:hypothetical protein
MCKEYSFVFRVTKQSPEWLQELIIEISNAWISFLENELEIKHFSLKKDYSNEESTRNTLALLKEHLLTLV